MITIKPDMHVDKNGDSVTMNSPSVHQDYRNGLSISPETLSNGFDYMKIENNNTSSKRRKLILHFDNRNTLQVANNVSSTTIEQGVNNFLTGVLWGYENANGEWKWISESPSLQQPNDCPSCITYFKYLENQIVKRAIDRQSLRVKTGSFVHNEGAPFRRFYDELIESLRYNKLGSGERDREDKILHNEQLLDTKEVPIISATFSPPIQIKRRKSVLHNDLVPVNGFRSANGTLYHYILPSFFYLVQDLQKKDRDFVIYLRTMGDDSTNFLHNAKRVLANEHPCFQFSKSTDVNLIPGRIKRNSDELISLEVKFEQDEEMRHISDEFLVHEKLESGHGINAIKDDFNAWFDKNYHYTKSKPVWFDPDDRNPRSHHILFDDNFRVIDPNDSIVDIRIMDRQKKKCHSCPFDLYPKLENVFAVQADLYLILADRNYYINKVEECERNLDQLLQDNQTLNEIKHSCSEHPC